MVDGMSKHAIHNRRLYNLFSATSVNDIADMALTDESLDELCKELDDYQASIKGLKRDICDIADMLSVEADRIFDML